MPPTAETLVDHIAAVVRRRLPPGITPAYLEGFLHRHRSSLVAILDRRLQARGRRSRSGTSPAKEVPAELWSASARTRANLAAMRVAASMRPEEMDAADRAALASYSGWGGLSIASVSGQFPTGFPVPEPRGLIHEYYTPTRVAREVARVIRPLVPQLPKADGVVLALEPSAGIGRFVQAASGAGFEALRWLVVAVGSVQPRGQLCRPAGRTDDGVTAAWAAPSGCGR